MYKYIKRFFDFTSSLIAIIILSPFLIPIMIGLKLTGEGHIFYYQKRLGYKNNYFNIFKFATMLKDSPNMGSGSITVRNDPRITPMGGFLRKTKINELPQLFNVLLGSMSVVGPRPLMQADFDAYPKHVQPKVYDVKPGITGIGSVVFRDEEKYFDENLKEDPKVFYERVIAPYKGELELWYANNQSFWVDLKIIFITFYSILAPESDIATKAFNNLPEKMIHDKK